MKSAVRLKRSEFAVWDDHRSSLCNECIGGKESDEANVLSRERVNASVGWYGWGKRIGQRFEKTSAGESYNLSKAVDTNWTERKERDRNTPSKAKMQQQRGPGRCGANTAEGTGQRDQWACSGRDGPRRLTHGRGLQWSETSPGSSWVLGFLERWVRLNETS